MTRALLTELTTVITITLLISAIIGIPVFHYAAAMIINTAWRHRHTGLTKPIYSTPRATPALRATHEGGTA